ncbi:Ig-like domain repeat protein [Methanosphaera sp. WGK6]|uniref:Ig-like domain repeat protein n=1 Tax=Methanosphaera sp. WGK6 TaxID=1561964 RepID=UPI00084C30E5|nr:Ig-like domain repeat protein [Methanosphaera sp. WGK6]OED29682.1 hypothetical protein NL43_07140 [Methanosphaera sp. WGK6]
MESKIKIDDIIIYKGEMGVITFEVTDENNNPVDGKVVIKLNKNTIVTSNLKEDGTFSQKCNFSKLQNSEYDIEVVYGGNKVCEPSTAQAKLYIKKAESIILSINDIQNASYRLTRWIDINKRLPGKILINENQVSIGNFLAILATTIKNINKNKLDDIKITEIGTPKVSRESITETILISQEEYMPMINEIINFIDENRESPSTIETSYGNIGFMNLAYTLATIVSNSSDTGILSGIYVRPWKKIITK